MLYLITHLYYDTYMYCYISGLDIIFTTMAAAFASLEVPHVYAMLFYLSVFIGGLMFVVSVLTRLNRKNVTIIDHRFRETNCFLGYYPNYFYGIPDIFFFKQGGQKVYK